MEDLLQHLEIKIKELIDQLNELKQSNQQLSHGKSALTREKELLLAKQQRAATQIETLVSKLKSIETLS